MEKHTTFRDLVTADVVFVATAGDAYCLGSGEMLLFLLGQLTLFSLLRSFSHTKWAGGGPYSSTVLTPFSSDC